MNNTPSGPAFVRISYGGQPMGVFGNGDASHLERGSIFRLSRRSVPPAVSLYITWLPQEGDKQQCGV